MKPIDTILGVVLLSLSVLQGCQGGSISASIPQVENKALVSNQALNSSIERYIDKYLSEIIRIRNFNPERAKKVFCVHHTVYVETAVTVPNAIHAYVKLLCMEVKPLSLNEVPTGAVSLLESKIYVQQYRQNQEERFQVVSEETPRDMPFYIRDKRQIFSNDMIGRLGNARTNVQADAEVIRKKALEYYRNKKANC